MINPIDFEGWNDLILQLNGYSFFHSKEWAKVLFESYKYEPVYFAIFENNELCSVLPLMLVKSWLTGNRAVSLPFSDHCEPLSNSITHSDVLMKEAISFCEKKKMKYIEFRSSGTKFPFEALAFRTDLQHSLRLNGNETELFNHFSENTRRNIKKSTKYNLTLKTNNDYSGLKLFYKMHCHTRKRHGLPPQPISFFNNIYKNIIMAGTGDILFTANNTGYIAGAIYFKFGTKILYKFGASVSDSNELGGNYFVMWEAIKKYISEGFKEFDFGRTEISHKGLQRFKCGWNTEELLIYTTQYNIKEREYQSASTKTDGIHNIIFNHSPIFLLKLIGKSVYKHIG